MMNHLAVYSTYCGSTNNRTFAMQPADKRYPHYFISNNSEILSIARNIGWTPIFLNLQVSDDPIISAMQAKIAKAIPHTISPLLEYDYLFYMDDKINVNINRMDEYVHILNESTSSVALRSHPFLLTNNVLYEFGQAVAFPIYRNQWDKTIEFISEEATKGCKLFCQLYWTSAILRNMKHPDIESLNNIWYQSILRCGTNCQISFDIVSQQFQSVTLLPLNIT